jgi:hypothetical protein
MTGEELHLVNDWEQASLPSIGARQKAWFIHPQTRRQGLVKVARRQPDGGSFIVEGELVGEYLASILGKALSIAVAEVEPVRYRIKSFLVRGSQDLHKIDEPIDELCPISWSFLRGGEELVHGSALTDSENEFRQDSHKLAQLSVDRILHALESRLEQKVARRYLVEMILFDILVGNTDRHQQNWGLVKGPSGFRPAPLFDNGAGFGCCHAPHNLDSINLDQFNSRFKHEFSVSSQPPKNSTIEELLNRCNQEDLRPAAVAFRHRLETIDFGTVWHDIHQRVLHEEGQRLGFAKGLLESRRTLIRDGIR